jgi:hypothetical protein
MAKPREADIITKPNQESLAHAVDVVGDARMNAEGIRESLGRIKASPTVKKAIIGVPGDAESPINGPLYMFFNSAENDEILVKVDMNQAGKIQFNVKDKAIGDKELAEQLSGNGISPRTVVDAINQQVESRAKNILEYATITENG